MDFGNHLEHFSLRWNNFNDNMKTGFHDLLRTEDFVDVTIAAEGKFIQAHKMILSVCSPYFKNLFKTNPCQHPVVFLKDVTHKELSGILQFMYLGEVSIQQEELGRFLKTAEALQIKGLTSDNSGDKSDGSVPVTFDEKHRHTVRSKTKLVNNELNDLESSSKKIKISPIRNSVSNGTHLSIKKSLEGLIEENELENGEEGIRVDEEDVEDSQEPSTDFFPKTEPSDLELLEEESDRMSFKEEGVTESYLRENNVSFKEDENHYPTEPHSAGLNQIYYNGIQGLANEPISLSEGNQGLEYLPLLTKNQGQCPICGRILQHKKNLQTHIADQHSGMLRSWPCRVCHKICKTWSALRVHMNRHHTKGATTSASSSSTSRMINVSHSGK